MNCSSDDPTTWVTHTVAEAAGRLGISQWAYYRAIHRGEVPAVRLGARYLVPDTMLREFMRTGTWQGRRAS